MKRNMVGHPSFTSDISSSLLRLGMARAGKRDLADLHRVMFSFVLVRDL